MLARSLDRAGEIKHVVGGVPGGGQDLGDGRAAEGERARLVEHDRVHAMGDLERRAAADEDACLRAAARPDHDGGRSGEAHRTRTSDDDDADEGRQRQRDARFRPERHPREERPGSDDEDDRDEHLGDAIGKPLDGSFAALGPTHEVHDPGERGVAPDPGRPHHERAGRVEGRTDDLGAGGHLDRHGFAGQHAGVDGGPALDDHAVDGYSLPGPDAQQVTDRHRLERHIHLAPVRHAPRGRGREPDKAPDRPGRAGLGAMLEPPTEQDQADDDRRGIEVGLRMESGLVDHLGQEGHDHAVEPGRARSDRHQRVHVGRAMPGGPPGGAIEATPRPRLDDRGRHEREPVDGLHRDAGLRHEHRDHDREGDRDGDDRLAEQRAFLACAFGIVRGQLLEQGDWAVRGVGVGPPRRDRADVVPGSLDGSDQVGAVGDVREEADRRYLGRQVHIRCLDAFGPGQEPLDTIDARRAGHALDGQFDLGCGGIRSVGGHTPGEYIRRWLAVRRRGGTLDPCRPSRSRW